MKPQDLAVLLNGREYGAEITDRENDLARAAGLVVVFGYSDDNAELRGAIHDEVSCYDGGEFWLDRTGVKRASDEEQETLEKFGLLDAYMSKANKIEAVWCGEGGYSWTYRTSIPHATFEILEDGEKFCRGIVFHVDDINPNPTAA